MHINDVDFFDGKQYIVTMPDGSVWAIPLEVIAINRAEYYMGEQGNGPISLEESLRRDTVPLFKACPSAIEDWARNNMEWADVVEHARRVQGPQTVDYAEGWYNGKVKIGEV